MTEMKFVSRYAKQLGPGKYRLNPVDAPLAYFDGSLYHPVSPRSLLDTSTSKAGGIFLRDKNVSTIGTKKTDDPYKFIGFRPDNRQNGDVQLEFSIESIEIDGKSVPVDLSKNEQVTAAAMNLGAVVVNVERNGCRVLIPCSRQSEGFKIVFRCHTKELNVMYRPRTDVWAMQDMSNGELKYRLRPPMLVDRDFKPIKGSRRFMSHTMTDIGGGEFRYIKESTALFADASARATLPEIFYIDASVSYSTYGVELLAIGGTMSWQTAYEKAVADYTDDSSTTWNLGCYIYNNDPYLHRVALQYDPAGIPVGNVLEASELISIASGGVVGRYFISQEVFSFDICYSYDGFQRYLGEMFGSTSNGVVHYNQLGRDYITSRLKAELIIQTMLREAYDYKNVDPSPDLILDNNSHILEIYSPNSEGNEPYLEITVETPATVTRNKQALQFIRNKWAVANDTLTVYEDDGVTEAWSAELTEDQSGQIVGFDPVEE